jgi:hypothetical protein
MVVHNCRQDAAMQDCQSILSAQKVAAKTKAQLKAERFLQKMAGGSIVTKQNPLFTE